MAIDEVVEGAMAVKVVEGAMAVDEEVEGVMAAGGSAASHCVCVFTSLDLGSGSKRQTQPMPSLNLMTQRRQAELAQQRALVGSVTGGTLLSDWDNQITRPCH